METIRRHARTQGETAGVVALALLAVLAYSLWGSYLLHNQRLSEAQHAVVADTR